MLFAAFASLMLIPSADAAPKPREWIVSDTKREAMVYLPGKTDKPAPVIFAFHGHGGTAAHAARTFAYQTHWPEAIVVYMQGLPTPGKLTDPEGKKSGWQSGAGDQSDRDLKFFDDVLKTLTKEQKLDEKRIYCTGHSNGGGFTYTLWAERGDHFAAVAPSAAIPNQASDVKNLKPKPCLHVSGTKDTLVKYDWQVRSMERERKLNGCETAGNEWAKAGELVGTEYASKTGTPYISLIGPGGHTFPEEAPKLIVQFFRQHEKK